MARYGVAPLQKRADPRIVLAPTHESLTVDGMKPSRVFLPFILVAGTAFAAAASRPAPLSAEQQHYLSAYEGVRAALAADDLAAAKKAARDVVPVLDPGAQSSPARQAAEKIAAADTLKAARDAFKTLSKDAVQVAAGQPGYFHAHCPMVPNHEGDWVQTSRTINNPYYGKSMLTCGEIE